MRIGIATSDPRIAAAVYRQMLADTKALVFNDYPDVAIYGSNLDDPHRVNGAGSYLHIKERADKLVHLNIEAMVLPDISASQIPENVKLQNRVAVQIPPKTLQRITSDMFDGIEQNIEKQKQPEDTRLTEKYDNTMKAIQGWADFARIKEQQNGEGYQIKRNTESQITTKHERILLGGRDAGGVIAISGGVTPQSTAEVLIYSSFKDNNALLAMSTAHTPNPVPKAMEINKKNIGKLSPLFEEDPLPVLIETTQMLAAAKPDVLVTICNTLSCHQKEIEKNARGVSVINLIEETVKAMPNNHDALLLGGEGIIANQSYEKMIEKYPSKGQLLIPKSGEQKIVNEALFHHILIGDFKTGGEMLKGLVDKYAKSDNSICVIGGCTEIGLGLRALNDNVLNAKIVDSALIGIDVATKVLSNSIRR